MFLSAPAGRVHSSQWPGRYSIPVQIVRAKHLSCEQRQTIDENREIGKHRSNTRNFLGCRCLWVINLNGFFVLFVFSVWGTCPCYLQHFGAKMRNVDGICNILEYLDLGSHVGRIFAASWSQHLNNTMCIMFTVI